jgi:cytochrome c556
MKRLRLIAALIVLPAISLAHEGATGIVKERMDAMTQAGKAVKSISEHIQANRNLGSIKDDALTIEANAGRIPSWFPPGSDQKPTDAKPEIWSHWDDFTARAAQLKDESAKLAAAAETGDPGAIGTQFRAVGRVCSGCHDQYRAKH